MLCEFQTTFDGSRYRHVSRRCAAVRTTDTVRLFRACSAGPRSDQDHATLAAICRTNACGRFDAANDACRSCGCTSQRHTAWLSRLRLGRCPAGKWPEV